MALHFSNASRNYDLARHCVRFWGHDSAFEISFYLNEEALSKISPYADRDEASLLHVFDVNRARIERAASVAYSHSLQRLDNSLAFRYVSWPEGYLHPFRVNNSAHLKKGQGNAD
jgi:hypothetical protein